MNNYNNINHYIYNSHMLMKVIITNLNYLALLKMMKIINKLKKRLIIMQKMMNFKLKTNEIFVFFENSDLNIY